MSENIAARDRLPFERQRYWQGQMLRSRDLNDQLALEMEMRSWHNRAIHEAFGIVNGLDVAPVIENGNRVHVEGGQLLVVSPGLAYDCYGREICLWRTIEAVAPAEDVLGGWTLLIRYPAQSSRAQAVCCLLPPTPQPPELLWKPSRQVKPTDGVPLVALCVPARAEFDESTAREAKSGNPLSFAVDHSVRLRARPEARPRIGYGATVQGQTAWQSWIVNLFGAEWRRVNLAARRVSSRKNLTATLSEVVIDSALGLGQLLARLSNSFVDRANRGLTGVETTIDTSTAGFAEPPVYFAWLGGHPAKSEARDLPTFTLGRITKSGADSFTYSILISADKESGLNLAVRHLYVCWMAIECLPPCTSTGAVDDERPC